MSYSFYVALDAPPDYQAVLSVPAVELDTRDGLSDDLPPGPWQDGHVLAVWQHESSTRPLELAWEDGSFSVRILACSCPEDYELALEIICAVADAAGGEVESEEGVSFAPADREEHYGPEWIEDSVRSMVDFAMAQAERAAEDGGSAQMPGPTRSFHLGQRVGGWLRDAAPAERADVLFDGMRALFYPDEERYYGANPMVVTREDGTEVTLTAFAPGVGYVFPPVELLAVLDEPPFEIRRDDLPELLGEDAVTWLDDAHMCIEPLEGAAWDDFVKKARSRAVDADLTKNGGSAAGRSAIPVQGNSLPVWIPIAVVILVLVAWLALR